ncbi:S-formylglutathione hydrolase FrmB [Natronobacillus azotifigens]|uniref:Alpha/beta hydrolase family protein n=1 Tax=Natronobacillus azotifigens TaxID=472978 RepID=A0A9J6R7Y3_9BACI|nr:alpha/beta hydrolase family protein [Natronobacillus azotifigens]MCZ0701733.1 alpha/beta hydrolase family protein [Natronobacillus azotifigens]
MARITCDFFSDTLMLNTTMTVLLPEQTTKQFDIKNKKRTKNLHPTLYLLHGFSDDHSIWTRRTSIERYAAEHGLAVVMPDVDHSFYTDMKYGKNYWTFLTEELPRVAQELFPLSDQREDNFVAGLSMGGYGAMKWALNKPEKFAAAATLSGVVDLVSHVKNKEEPLEQTLFHVFGEEDIEGSMHDVLHLLKKVDQSSGPKPKIYHACGTEDFLFEGNKLFKSIADQTKLDVKTTFDVGTHEWGYWDEHIKRVLQWLPLKEE